MIQTRDKCPQSVKFLLCAMLLTAALFITGMPKAAAATVEVGDFTIDRSRSYSTYVVSVKSYNGTGGDVALPETAEFSGVTYPITSLGSALQGNTKVTSLTIPEGYTDIETSALSGCTALKSVTIPGSMTMISSNAFENCTALDTISFSADTAATLSLRNNSFTGCTALQSVTLPARTSSLDNNIFRGCTSLSELKVAPGCTAYFSEGNILYEAYDDAVTLIAYPGGLTATEYDVPETVNGKTVTALGPMAFSQNTVLTRVSVPASVVKYDRFCFDSCAALTSLTLGCTEAPSLGSSAFTNLPKDSTIYVANDTVAAALEPQNYYTYYTSGNTTVTVKGAEPETVSAALSVAPVGVQDGNVSYQIFLDSASHVNTLLLKLAFDKTQVNQGNITAQTYFTPYVEWDDSGDQLIAKVMLYATGNDTGFSAAEKTHIATVTLPAADGATGKLSMTVEKALVSGIVNAEEKAVDGTVTINSGSAVVAIPNYDVNRDGSVNQVDITEAQRYYQAKSGDANWDAVKNADVNLDDVVDIQDLVDIFHHIDF